MDGFVPFNESVMVDWTNLDIDLGIAEGGVDEILEPALEVDDSGID